MKFSGKDIDGVNDFIKVLEYELERQKYNSTSENNTDYNSIITLLYVIDKQNENERELQLKVDRESLIKIENELSSKVNKEELVKIMNITHKKIKHDFYLSIFSLVLSASAIILMLLKVFNLIKI